MHERRSPLPQRALRNLFPTGTCRYFDCAKTAKFRQEELSAGGSKLRSAGLSDAIAVPPDFFQHAKIS